MTDPPVEWKNGTRECMNDTSKGDLYEAPTLKALAHHYRDRASFVSGFLMFFLVELER